MLVLFESSAGYALFKVNNESKLSKVDNIMSEFETPEKANKLLVERAAFAVHAFPALSSLEHVLSLTPALCLTVAVFLWLHFISSRTSKM